MVPSSEPFSVVIHAFEYSDVLWVLSQPFAMKYTPSQPGETQLWLY